MQLGTSEAQRNAAQSDVASLQQQLTAVQQGFSSEQSAHQQAAASHAASKAAALAAVQQAEADTAEVTKRATTTAAALAKAEVDLRESWTEVARLSTELDKTQRRLQQHLQQQAHQASGNIVSHDIWSTSLPVEVK